MVDNSKKYSLSIPRPSNDLRPLEVDLTKSYQAEGLLPSISAITPQNATYYMEMFGCAYNELAKAYGLLVQEVGLATVKARKRRAVLTLDILPQVIRDKGLSTARSPLGSEDVREAIYYTDEQYTNIEEFRAKIEAVKEMVALKIHTFKQAYYAASNMSKVITEGAHSKQTITYDVDSFSQIEKDSDDIINGQSPPKKHWTIDEFGENPDDLGAGFTPPSQSSKQEQQNKQERQDQKNTPKTQQKRGFGRPKY